MRHRKSGRHLNRTSSHRRLMFRNMVASVVKYEIIKTTLPKAKELRGIIEPLITFAKEDTPAHRRLVFARVRSEEAVDKLFTDLGERYKDRAGGYTRVIKCGHRKGDSAPMAYFELVDRFVPEVDDKDKDKITSAQAEQQDTKDQAEQQDTQDQAEQQDTQDQAEQQDTQDQAEQQDTQDQAEQQDTKDQAEQQDTQDQADQQDTQDQADQQDTQDQADQQDKKDKDSS